MSLLNVIRTAKNTTDKLGRIAGEVDGGWFGVKRSGLNERGFKSQGGEGWMLRLGGNVGVIERVKILKDAPFPP